MAVISTMRELVTHWYETRAAAKEKKALAKSLDQLDLTEPAHVGHRDLLKIMLKSGVLDKAFVVAETRALEVVSRVRPRSAAARARLAFIRPAPAARLSSLRIVRARVDAAAAAAVAAVAAVAASGPARGDRPRSQSAPRRGLGRWIVRDRVAPADVRPFGFELVSSRRRPDGTSAPCLSQARAIICKSDKRVVELYKAQMSANEAISEASSPALVMVALQNAAETQRNTADEIGALLGIVGEITRVEIYRREPRRRRPRTIHVGAAASTRPGPTYDPRRSRGVVFDFNAQALELELLPTPQPQIEAPIDADETPTDADEAPIDESRGPEVTGQEED